MSHPELQPQLFCSSSVLAVCSCLSPALRYKVSVICSVKCSPQTEAQLKVRQQRHPVPPGPATHRKRGCSRSPVSGSRACFGPATQALMQGDTHPNDSLISPLDPGPSQRPLRIRPRICSMCFVLSCPSHPRSVPSLKF